MSQSLSQSDDKEIVSSLWKHRDIVKSAKGALIKARSSENTACFDLRGKLINTLKNDKEKINKNEEIRQLHIALGCGIGDKFNIKKLRYGRIVICADMDENTLSNNAFVFC